MINELSVLLKKHIERVGLSVSRVAGQARIPKQTLFNWCGGRLPRWHPQLPAELANLSRALGLNAMETDELLLAAGCVCAVDTPQFAEAAEEDLALPNGWFRAGSHPKQYDMGIDPMVRFEKLPAAVIGSRSPRCSGFGTLMQTCLPGKFLGERVRLSAMARTESVEEWAGLWFRVDGPDRKESLNFDNMQDRPLSGTREWSRYSIVLDVANDSSALAYGILLSGHGRAWVADVRIEVVGLDVPSTNLSLGESGIPPAPVNLDFTDDAS